MAPAILGAWVGVTVFMWFVATASFSTVDRVLKAPDPELARATNGMAQGQSRAVFRHVASEINRSCFRAYGWSQILLGAFLIFLLLRQSPRDNAALVIAGVMLGLVLVLTLAVMPALVTLGRSIDFVPRSPIPAQIARFRILHATYTILDGLKLIAGVALLVRSVATR